MAAKQKPKLTIEEVRRICREKALLFLGEAYKGRHHAASCKCMVCGHEWSPRFGKLLGGQGCPVCSHRKAVANRTAPIESFQDTFDSLGLEILGEARTSARVRKFRFRCRKCGFVFVGSPYAKRFHKTGCKKCGNLRAGADNRLSSEEVDKRLRRRGVTRLAEFKAVNKKMSVRYDTCGHSLEMTVNSIMHAKRCPKCIGHVRLTASEYDEVAKRFRGEVLQMGRTVSNKAHWRCSEGHKFWRPIADIKYQGRFCPKCFNSIGEELTRAVAERLLGVLFEKRRIRELRGDSRYPLELDLFNQELKLAIEHHGEQHYQPQANWGGGEAFEAIKSRDDERRSGCKKIGITLLEVRSLDKVTSLEDFREALKTVCVDKGFPMAADFAAVSLEDIKNTLLIPACVRHLQRLRDAALKRGYRLIETRYKGSQNMHLFECPNGHMCEVKPNKFLGGRGCTKCKKSAHNKIAVLIHGVGKFDSITRAAEYLGVGDGTLCTAIKLGRKCRGSLVTKYDA